MLCTSCTTSSYLDGLARVIFGPYQNFTSKRSSVAGVERLNIYLYVVWSRTIITLHEEDSSVEAFGDAQRIRSSVNDYCPSHKQPVTLNNYPCSRTVLKLKRMFFCYLIWTSKRTFRLYYEGCSLWNYETIFESEYLDPTWVFNIFQLPMFIIQKAEFQWNWLTSYYIGGKPTFHNIQSLPGGSGKSHVLLLTKVY